MKITLIDDQKSFDLFLEKAKADFLWALDTEGDFDNFTYGRDLCLIQLALSEEPEVVYVIDPLSGIDLQEMIPLLENKNILKIMFAGDTDNRLIHEIWGIHIKGIWDVFAAAQVLEEKPAGMSALLSKYLNFKPSMNKDKYQRANWTLRPLADDMLTYAAEDVVGLFGLKDALEAQINTPGRKKRFEARIQKAENAQFNTNPRPWEKMKGTAGLRPAEMARVKIAYLLRDFLAKSSGKPPYFISSHEKIVNWAIDSQSIRELFPKASQEILSWAQDLLKAEVLAQNPNNKARKKTKYYRK